MQPIEIVFNFDTTGSMNPCIRQLRSNIVQVVGDLFSEIPGLRVGIGANGDYGDLVASGYDTTHIDLTNNVNMLNIFVQNVKPTYGFGNGGECYELVLHRAQTAFSWTPEAKKVLVMIGDEKAHLPSWHENKDRLDWRVEANKLADMGVAVYSVQALSRRDATSFWQDLSEIGGGYYLQLDQFTDIMTLISAIVYRQDSDEKLTRYEEKVVKAGANRTVRASLEALKGQPRDSRGRFISREQAVAYQSQQPNVLMPVPIGRFQVMDVTNDVVIKDFVQDNGLQFQPGKGFYEFTKRETIQDKKEIVIVENDTGDMFTGNAARQLLGIPLGMGKGKISPKHGDKYTVFVQSTSFNRKLKGNTKFLYEVDMSL